MGKYRVAVSDRAKKDSAAIKKKRAESGYPQG